MYKECSVVVSVDTKSQVEGRAGGNVVFATRRTFAYAYESGLRDPNFDAGQPSWKFLGCGANPYFLPTSTSSQPQPPLLTIPSPEHREHEKEDDTEVRLLLSLPKDSISLTMPPKSSLASLLGTLTNAAPVDFDPEALDADQPGPSSYNGNDSGSSSGEDDDDEKNDEGDEEEEYMNPRAHYADVGPSDMRKKAAISESDKINDARYQGVKSSRAELYADDDGDEEEDEEDEDEDDPSDASNGDDGEEDEEEESDSDEDDDNDDDDDDDTEGEESAPSRKKQLRFADDASDNASESDSQED